MNDNQGQKFVKMDKDKFLEEVLNLVESAKNRGIELRILGSLAVYLHIQNNPICLDLLSKLGRFEGSDQLFTDLDLICYSKQRKEVSKFFEELGFKPDLMVNTLFGNKRLIFYHMNNSYHIDIFVDSLEFSHDIHFGNDTKNGRLSLDYPTISITDLVLEKLQIHEINRKDLVDLFLIFLSHDVSLEPKSKEEINAKHIANVLCDDWGFWYDALINLNKLKDFANNILVNVNLNKEIIDKFNERVDFMIKILNEYPKTKKWIKRSKEGTKKPWYREVDELVR
jgi:hypothetical protein